MERLPDRPSRRQLLQVDTAKSLIDFTRFLQMVEFI
jgi:hypothetical protein